MITATPEGWLPGEFPGICRPFPEERCPGQALQLDAGKSGPEASRMLLSSTITARRTLRYTSTLYIHRTIHGVGYNPVNDGRRYTTRSPIVGTPPPTRPTLTPSLTFDRRSATSDYAGWSGVVAVSVVAESRAGLTPGSTVTPWVPNSSQGLKDSTKSLASSIDENPFRERLGS